MEFGIDDITDVLTLTDSGSNFLKAFRLFGAHGTEKQLETDEEEDDDAVVFNLKI